MTDLNARQGEFRKWTPEQAGERLVEAVKIINRHVSFGVAVSCDIAEVARLVPRTADPGSMAIFGGFAHAYALCGHMAMRSLAKVVQEVNPGKEASIAYFFEAGDLHQSASRRFIDEMVAMTIGKKFYGHSSHNYMSKECARAFEMTDILAWEWAKHIDRVRQGNTKMRGSLKALLDVQSGFSSDYDFASHSRRALHLHGEGFARYFRQAEEMGMFSDHPTDEQLRAIERNLSRVS